MHSFIKKTITGLIVGSLMVTSTSAGVITRTGMERELETSLLSVQDEEIADYARTQIDSLITILPTQTPWDDKKHTNAYRTEIFAYATKFLSDIRAGKYTSNLSPTEKTHGEQLVLSYQKELISVMQEALKKYTSLDQRESGNIKFSLNSGRINGVLRIDRYKTIISKDGQNIELDAKISIEASGKEIEQALNQKTIYFMVDGNIKLIKNNLYFLLRDYGTNIPSQELDSIEKYLLMFKGKTYHQEIDSPVFNDIFSPRNSSEAYKKQLEASLDILAKEPILTPILKKGDELVLGLRSKTLIEIAVNIFGQDIPDTLNIDTLEDILIPVNITLSKTNRIDISGWAKSMSYSGYLERGADGAVVLQMDTLEKLTSNPTHIKLSRTQQFWALAASNNEYELDASANKTGATASIKNNQKIIASAFIQSQGGYSWKYGMSGSIEDSYYDYENEKEVEDNILLELFGEFIREFGIFNLSPPTLYEELENSQYMKVMRDDDRIFDLEQIQSNIKDYKWKYKRYPSMPKDGCVASIWIPKNYYYGTFSYYTDEKKLGAGSCKDGYYYRTLEDVRGNMSYLIVSRTETPEEANFDGSVLNFMTASHRDIQNSLTQSGVTSLNSKDWYYVIIQNDWE